MVPDRVYSGTFTFVNAVVGALDTQFEAVVASADGAVTGTVPWGESELTGYVVDGVFDGDWTLVDDYGAWSFPLSGIVTDTTFYATGEGTNDDFGDATVTFDGTAD